MHPHLPQIESIREIFMLESASIESRAATSISVPNGSSLTGAVVAAGETDVSTGAAGTLVEGSAGLFPMHPRVDAATTRTIRIYTSFIF
jgi:hypothetical protein